MKELHVAVSSALGVELNSAGPVHYRHDHEGIVVIERPVMDVEASELAQLLITKESILLIGARTIVVNHTTESLTALKNHLNAKEKNHRRPLPTRQRVSRKSVLTVQD